MYKNLTKILALGMVVFSLVACGGGSDGPDTEAPTISISKPNSTDLNKRGSDLPLIATFKDNRGLDKCVITIEFQGVTPKQAILKGIDTPWAPAENNEKHEIIFNSEKTADVNETQLFNMPIENSCSSGTYTLTFTITDTAEEPNTTVETLDIQIGG